MSQGVLDLIHAPTLIMSQGVFCSLTFGHILRHKVGLAYIFFVQVRHYRALSCTCNYYTQTGILCVQGGTVALMAESFTFRAESFAFRAEFILTIPLDTRDKVC